MYPFTLGPAASQRKSFPRPARRGSGVAGLGGGKAFGTDWVDFFGPCRVFNCPFGREGGRVF